MDVIQSYKTLCHCAPPKEKRNRKKEKYDSGLMLGLGIDSALFKTRHFLKTCLVMSGPV